MRGGEALRVTKPVSPPRAPPLWARLKTMQTIVFGLKNAAGTPSAFFYTHPLDVRPLPAFFYIHPLDAHPFPAFFYIIRWTPTRSLRFFISSGGRTPGRACRSRATTFRFGTLFPDPQAAGAKHRLRRPSS